MNPAYPQYPRPSGNGVITSDAAEPFPGGDPRSEPVPASLLDRLLAQRIVLVHGVVDDARATTLCAHLMTLDATGDTPIELHLRTPDATLSAALTVADTVDALTAAVHAVVMGEVGGPALVILAAAHRRQAAPHATFRLAEPRVELAGSVREISAAVTQHQLLLDAWYARMAAGFTRSADELRFDTQAGRYFNAVEAVEYGLVESIAIPPPNKFR